MNTNDYKFVFIILHYLTTADTERCVNSILKLHGINKSVRIVIVDNDSPNRSGQVLKEQYSKNSQITVILAQQNLGFARGNNLGFHYSKYNLGADFIVMLNNDTYIAQSNFLEKIVQEYNDSNFAVLGPKIILNDNTINSIYQNLQSTEHYKKDLSIIKLEYCLNRVHLYPIYKFARKNMSKFLVYLGLKKQKTYANPNRRYKDIILHGSALIFSKMYIKKFDGLDDRTFLYREEELLYLRLKHSGLHNVYSPELEVYHNEDSSTDALTGGGRRKRSFVMKNLIDSTELLISEIKKAQ